MKLHTLRPAEGSTKNNKRLGRGQGSGGSTAGRGHKGAQSRSGYKKKFGFEGGQMPLQMRLPKIGFRNPARQEYEVLNLDQLQSYSTKAGITSIDINWLLKERIINPGQKVKILGRGELASALNITAHGFSASAKKTIEEKGGSITII